MAINLTVSLTDQEQALIQALALRVDSNFTGPQIVAWAEKECKRGLRRSVMEIKQRVDDEDAKAAFAAAQAQAAVDFPKVT
jgi:uncharacterized membrane protein